MIELNKFRSDLFYISHLTENDYLNDFKVVNPKGEGLRNYLLYAALGDEKANIARTYLVKDKNTEEIVAYFTLRTGLITISRGLFRGFDAITGIELANFAVNDEYKIGHQNEKISKLGSYIFFTFIMPLTQEISKYVGAALLYIFALPEDGLMAHYETMGFVKTSEKMERFVYRHVKPAYDKSCRFMVRKIL